MKLYRITRTIELQASIVVEVPDHITEDHIAEVMNLENGDLEGILDYKTSKYEANETDSNLDYEEIAELGRKDATAISYERFIDDLKFCQIPVESPAI